MRLFLPFTLLLLGACGPVDRSGLEGLEASVPDNFRFLGRSAPCYLEVLSTELRSIRVNCFHIDGVLYIHSNRFAKMPRLRGESWVKTVRRNPWVRVAISGKIYSLQAIPINDLDLRKEILYQRGYWYAWDGITVFRFTGRSTNGQSLNSSPRRVLAHATPVYCAAELRC